MMTNGTTTTLKKVHLVLFFRTWHELDDGSHGRDSVFVSACKQLAREQSRRGEEEFREEQDDHVGRGYARMEKAEDTNAERWTDRHIHLR